jgi:hypothetical protein
MYGENPKAIPETFSYHEKPTSEQQLRQLDQWRKDALIAYKYAQQKMKEKIKSTYEPLAKGQKVWLERRNLALGYNKKITTKREGPFEILEVYPPVNYKLKLPEKWRMYNVFHASLLTPYRENEVHGPNFTRPPPDLIDNEPEWEVERIIRHCGKKNLEYQVKWRGYAEYTWEPAGNLEHAPDIINDY